jgi:hypothetical protein
MSKRKKDVDEENENITVNNTNNSKVKLVFRKRPKIDFLDLEIKTLEFGNCQTQKSP